MKIAYITMNRWVEDRAATDEDCRRQLRLTEKVLLRDGRALSDEALLAKLRSLGIALDKGQFLARSQQFLSAQEMAEVVHQRKDLEIKAREEDWVWIAFTCFWERWQPERPSLEMIDDWMQAGYKASQRRDRPETCRFWLATWKAVWNVIEARRIRSLEEYDALFPGTQFLSNWVQDFTLELHNAGLADPSFLRERIAVLEALLGRLELEDLLLDNCRRDLAETYFAVGLAEKGEQLFRDWLGERPRWGWGWIGWSDAYNSGFSKQTKDPARAEQLLKQGLAVPGVEDRNEILDRLARLYDNTSRKQEAAAVREEMRSGDRHLGHPPATRGGAAAGPAAVPKRRLPPEDLGRFTSAPKGPAKQAKIGRNDPCRCGSGKKFKRCCGRNTS